MSDLVLVFTLRASERIPTHAGLRLTRITPCAPELLAWSRAQRVRLHGQKPSRVLADALDNSTILPVLRGCLDRCFEAVEIKEIARAQGRCIELRHVQGWNGRFRLCQTLLGLSAPYGFSGVEGDEVVVVLILERASSTEVELPEEHEFLLDRPPASGADAARCIFALAAAELPIAFSQAVEAMPAEVRTGFYSIGVQALFSTETSLTMEARALAFDDWRSSPSGSMVAALLAAYLMRCYVCAQRLERQLLDFEPAGDWDLENRRLLLARGRHLALTRFALLKNRAMVDAPVLAYYESVLTRLRIRTLATDLGALLSRCDEVLQAQNTYLDSSRIRTIEAVLFVASALSLAIALNAIQMPPFYDSVTKNALTRTEFWLVTLATAALFGILWGVINGWRHTRRALRWLRSKLFRLTS